MSGKNSSDTVAIDVTSDGTVNIIAGGNPFLSLPQIRRLPHGEAARRLATLPRRPQVLRWHLRRSERLDMTTSRGRGFACNLTLH